MYLHPYTFSQQNHVDHGRYRPNHSHQLRRISSILIDRTIEYIPTVENRIKTRVFVPFLNTFALQISDKSSLASKTPKAPPLNKKNSRSCCYRFFLITLTLSHEQLVPVLVLDRIVEYLQYTENPKVTTVLVVQR